MSDYTITTDFGAKDSLNTGDPGKVVKGSEFTTEFEAIKTAVNSKSDKASPTFTGTATIPTASVTTLNLGGTAVTSTAAELNLLDGVTATTAELNYVDGVTSSVQTQLDAKVDDSDFTQSFASNGWTELPNGLIIQWGRVSIAAESSNVSVSFPKAFTTACLQVVASAEDDSTTRSRNDFIGTTAPTTTTFSITNGINTALNFRFIAIGH